jgi:peptide/nickel transport system substrate-binding protein
MSGVRRVSRRQFLASAAVVLVSPRQLPGPGHLQPRQEGLIFVPHAPLRVLDPIWTPAHVTRNHGYLIYDTLFGTDAAGRIRPQMVDRYTVSDSRLRWSFTLRNGLRWHDGRPVTAEDCVQSLARWSRRDPLGRRLAVATRRLVALDATSFELVLAEPFRLVLEALGRPSSYVPFIMPARIAATPEHESIKEFVGSGPFRLAEWIPGTRTVYLRNHDYIPRSDAPSGAAGGKHALMTKITWSFDGDPDSLGARLLEGKIDWCERLPARLLSTVRGYPHATVVVLDRHGFQGWLLPNHLHAPFNHRKARQALVAMMDQERYLRGIFGDAGSAGPCPSVFPCGGPGEPTVAAPQLLKPDPDRARQLVKESGYDGRPIIVLGPTDLPIGRAAAHVTRDLLTGIGVNVDLQLTDWNTVLVRRARQEPPHLGGWHLLVTWWSAWDIADPVGHAGLGGTGDRPWIGWAESAEMARLRTACIDANDSAERRGLLERIQQRALDEGMYVPFGQWVVPSAHLRNVVGILPFGAPLFWNVRDVGRKKF